MKAIGEEFAKHFADKGLTRIVTIESSGIAPAAFTALAMGLPACYYEKADVKNHERQSFANNSALFYERNPI